MPLKSVFDNDELVPPGWTFSRNPPGWLLFLKPLEIRVVRNFRRIRGIWWPSRDRLTDRHYQSRFLDLRHHCKGWALSVMGP
jgi:hypothetical protein